MLARNGAFRVFRGSSESASLLKREQVDCAVTKVIAYPDVRCGGNGTFFATICELGLVRSYLSDTNYAHPITEKSNEKVCAITFGHGLIFTGNQRGIVRAKRLSNGHTIWSVRLSRYDVMVSALAVVDERCFVVGTGNGKLILMWHQNGRNIRTVPFYGVDTDDKIIDITAVGGALVVLHFDGVVMLWRLETRQFVKRKIDCQCATANSTYIVIARNDGMCIFQNDRDFTDIDVPGDDLRNSGIVALQFVSENILMVVYKSGTIVYLNGKEKWKQIARESINACVRSVCMLSDGRIAMVGTQPRNKQKGFTAIVWPPKSLEYLCSKYARITDNYRQRIPLTIAEQLVRDGKLGCKDALAECLSEDEWAANETELLLAHDILMKGVKEGRIPRSTSYNGCEKWWHNRLYKHIVHGHVRNFDQVVYDAREHGVLDERLILYAVADLRKRVGTVEQRVTKHDLDLEAVKNKIANMEVKQKRASQLQLIFAFLGFVPVLGNAVATAVGLTEIGIMEGNGLIESLLGAKVGFANIAASKLADKFQLFCKDVVKKDVWDTLPVGRRTDLENKMYELGELDVHRLRHRFRLNS